MNDLYSRSMKLFAFITIAFFGLAEAQIVLHDSAIDWPQNNNTLGGALFGLSYGSLGSGSCIVQLPEMVNLFHVRSTNALVNRSNVNWLTFVCYCYRL